MLNKVVLIGRLTKDPELRYTPSGIAIAQFTLAVDRPFTNQQGERDTDFIRTKVWRKQAENCAKFIGKGSLVAVEGRIEVSSFEGQDGQRRWVTDVVADNVRFLDSRGKGNNTNDDPLASFGSEEVRFDEDVPF